MSRIQELKSKVERISIPYGEALASSHLIELQNILREIVSEVQIIDDKLNGRISVDE